VCVRLGLPVLGNRRLSTRRLSLRPSAMEEVFVADGSSKKVLNERIPVALGTLIYSRLPVLLSFSLSPTFSRYSL
jgi:hypothetical protein